jgi:hypothetical protein
MAGNLKSEVLNPKHETNPKSKIGPLDSPPYGRGPGFDIRIFQPGTGHYIRWSTPKIDLAAKTCS